MNAKSIVRGGVLLVGKTRSFLSAFLIIALLSGAAAPLVAFASGPVTGVTVSDADSGTVVSGDTDQMSATVAPVDATTKTVTWSVTNGSGSATIDPSSGLLTATGAGSVTVTATATDDIGVTGTENITVNPAVVVTTHTLTYTAGANGTITDSDVTADVSVTANFTAVTGTYAVPPEAPPYTINSSATGVNVLEAFIKTPGVSFANPGFTNLDSGWSAATVNPTYAAEYSATPSPYLAEDLNIAVGAPTVVVDFYAFTGCTTQPASPCTSADLTDAYQVTFTNGNYSSFATNLSAATLAAENTTVPVTGVTLGDTGGNAGSLAIGATDNLSATVVPADATTPAVTWSSDNTTVATVDASGVVTAVTAGTAHITAVSTDGSNITSNAITVTVPLSDLTALTTAQAAAQALITANAAESTTPGNHVVGSLATLSAALTAANATDLDAQSVVDGQTSTLNSAITAYNAAIVQDSNLTALTAEIATANAALVGVVEGTVPGNHVVGSSATLTTAITAAQGVTDADAQSVVDAAVTTLTSAVSTFNAAIVPAVPVTGVTLNESTNTLTVGNTDQLVATIAPVGATDQAVTYTSDTPTVATVSATGLITAVAAGTATITVTTTDGSFTATDAITVNAAAVVAPVVSSGGGGGGGGLLGSYGQVSNGYGGYTTPGVTTVTTTSGTGGQVLGAAAYNFANNLTVGSTGNDVTQLQTILIAEGDLSIGTPSGYFGALTKAAVIKYQTAHGISPQSGYVGSLTRGVLNLGTTPTTPESNTGTTGSGLTSTQVQAIIGLLQSFGADASVIANVTAALNK